VNGRLTKEPSPVGFRQSHSPVDDGLPELLDEVQVIVLAEVDDDETVLPELVGLGDGVEEITDGKERELKLVKIVSEEFVLPLSLRGGGRGRRGRGALSSREGGGDLIELFAQDEENISLKLSDLQLLFEILELVQRVVSDDFLAEVLEVGWRRGSGSLGGTVDGSGEEPNALVDVCVFIRVSQ
jgi:hypothetical protein